MENNPIETCLVTGGSGLLGKGIQEAILKREPSSFQEGAAKILMFSGKRYVFPGHELGDCRDISAMRVLFKMFKPTAVIHLAARVGGLFANMEDNIGFFEDNMAINQCITRLCHEFSVQRAVFCLSTCVFPADAICPLAEEDMHNGPPHFSNEGYATAKRNLEMLVRFYRKKYNYSWLCVTPTNLYGKHDNFNLKDAHVMPALIHKCYIARSKNEPFIVLGSGNPLRQFLYVTDAGELILRLLNMQPDELNDKHNFILCGDEDSGEHSIREIADIIAKKLNFTGNVVYDSSKADGIYRKTASNKLLRETIGKDFRFTRIEEGIANTIDWFEENAQKIRR